MKKLFMLLAIISVSALSLSAQYVESEKNETIVFNQLEHDYGTITQGADGNCEFGFTNNGQKPLVLSNVRASCGCTVPTWPKEPIQPGETGVIKVKYDTKRVGSFNKSITVSSNAENSTVILRIKGNVK
ncbi:MAG: DUF1573 domain-containing protein [Bacteroidales bacterium]|jgi:hypothetical protein|nr:DUF1573 domain-containing protein [Bacteroidales bacterium]